MEEGLQGVELGSDQEGLFEAFLSGRLEKGEKSFGSERPFLLVGVADDRLILVFGDTWEEVDRFCWREGDGADLGG